MWLRFVVGMSVLLGLVACGQSPGTTLTGRPVTPAQWRAVLRDWYDGRITDRHSCGAVVVASSHLPVDPPAYSTVVADLARYAAKVCTHDPDLAAVKVGMTNADVAAVAGAPRMPANSECWDYRGGLTVCFRAGRVVRRNRVP